MAAVADAPRPVHAISGAPAVVRALVSRLAVFADVVGALDRTAYARVPEGGFSGSAGAHVRHAIDHVAALVDRRHDEDVDYSSRRRGTDVETDPAAAVGELRRLAAAVAGLAPAALPRGIRVRDVVERGDDSTPLTSTLERELVFVLHHLVHHEALIAFVLAGEAVRAPAGFGVAASTPLQRRTCVLSA